MVALRTGYNKNKNVKTDYQGTIRNKNSRLKDETHTLSYIKGGIIGKSHVLWFESDLCGRVYVVSDKELIKSDFYNKKYKTRNIKVIGKVYKNGKLKIKEVY